MRKKITIDTLYDNLKHSIYLAKNKDNKFIFDLKGVEIAQPTSKEIYDHLKNLRPYDKWDNTEEDILKFLETYKTGDTTPPTLTTKVNIDLLDVCKHYVRDMIEELTQFGNTLDKLYTLDEMLLNTEELILYWKIKMDYVCRGKVLGGYNPLTDKTRYSIESFERKRGVNFENN